MYEVDVFKENVILGNDALFKCRIPSFVQDFAAVESWADSEGANVLRKDFDGSRWLRCKVVSLNS